MTWRKIDTLARAGAAEPEAVVAEAAARDVAAVRVRVRDVAAARARGPVEAVRVPARTNVSARSAVPLLRTSDVFPVPTRTAPSVAVR